MCLYLCHVLNKKEININLVKTSEMVMNVNREQGLEFPLLLRYFM